MTTLFSSLQLEQINSRVVSKYRKNINSTMTAYIVGLKHEYFCVFPCLPAGRFPSHFNDLLSSLRDTRRA